MSITLDQISKLPPAMQKQVMADQARATAARERIMAQVKSPADDWKLHRKISLEVSGLLSSPAPATKSPRKAVSVAGQAILPQIPGLKVKSKAPKQDESRMQQTVIRWFRDNCYEWQRDEDALMAFPLQGKRTARNGARMKAEGMRKGTPDMLLAVPRGDCAGLWIELKTAKGYLNPNQKVMLKRLTAAGYATIVCRSVEETTHAIRAYLNLPTPSKP